MNATLPHLYRTLLLSGLLTTLSAAPALAQRKPAPKPTPKATPKTAAPAEPVYYLNQVQIQPEYAEGQFALQQYLSKSVRIPAEVKEGNVSGSVQVDFIVRPDGRLTDVFVRQGISAACNAEALRLVQAMPPWRPGRRDDKAVATRFAVAVKFADAAVVDKISLSGSDLAVREEVAENKPYMYVEQMPEFPGGMSALQRYLSTNLRYPAQAREQEVEGRVFVKFIVQTDGSPGSVGVLKGIGAGCDEEAVRLVTDMPRWTPGKQNGRVVPVYYTLPITFQLNAPPPAPEPKPEERIYTHVEQMPAYHGNPAGIAAALQAAVQLPAPVREGRNEGPTAVEFVVNPDGSTRDVRITRSLCPSCDEALMAAVRALPALEPGKQNGQAVPVRVQVPVMLFGPNHVYEQGQVPTAASFPGGPDALRRYLAERLREPKFLKKENLSGAVTVRFVVQADGSIGATEVLRSYSRSCDEEALRLVRAMPRWQPARNVADQPVAMHYTLTVQMPTPETPRRGRTGFRVQPLHPSGSSATTLAY